MGTYYINADHSFPFHLPFPIPHSQFLDLVTLFLCAEIESGQDYLWMYHSNFETRKN